METLYGDPLRKKAHLSRRRCRAYRAKSCIASLRSHTQDVLRLNDDVVVGFQASPERRFRLDFDKNWQQKVGNLKREIRDWKRGFPFLDEYRGVHINEENFDAPPGLQRILHLTEASELMMDTYYRKWSAQYRAPGYKK